MQPISSIGNRERSFSGSSGEGETKGNRTRITLLNPALTPMKMRRPCHLQLMLDLIAASPDELDSPPASPGRPPSALEDDSLVLPPLDISGDEDEIFNLTVDKNLKRSSSPSQDISLKFDEKCFDDKSLKFDEKSFDDKSFDDMIEKAFDNISPSGSNSSSTTFSDKNGTFDNFQKGTLSSPTLSSPTRFEITSPSKEVDKDKDKDQLVLSSPERGPVEVEANRKRGRGKPKGPQLNKKKKEPKTPASKVAKPVKTPASKSKPVKTPAPKPVKGKKGQSSSKKGKNNKKLKGKETAPLDAELDAFSASLKGIEDDQLSDSSLSSEPEAPEDFKRNVISTIQQRLTKKVMPIPIPSTSTSTPAVPKKVKITKKAKKSVDKVVKTPKAFESLAEYNAHLKKRGGEALHPMEKFFKRNKDPGSNPKKVIVDGEEIDESDDAEDDDPRGNVYIGIGKGLKRKKKTGYDLSDSDSGLEEIGYKARRYDRDVGDTDDDDGDGDDE